MKKKTQPTKPKKLELSKQTIKTLSEKDLRVVAGATTLKVGCGGAYTYTCIA